MGSFRPTGVVGGPKLASFEEAALLLMAMFATGDLGDDALKKTPSKSLQNVLLG